MASSTMEACGALTGCHARSRTGSRWGALWIPTRRTRDADMEANYADSDSDEDDSLDGDLGRICRGAGLVDVGIAAGSDSDEELGGLGAISGQQSRASYDDMGALQALITPESAAPMD